MPQLSIVIAAYNEEKRLPTTLARLMKFLEGKIRYEMVIVDDGSRDNTLAWMQRYSQEHPNVRVLTHFPNRGRGTSIREGVLSATGEYVLETDADGSVADEAIVRFVKFLDDHPTIDVVIGNRRMPGSVIDVAQPRIRVLIGYCFVFLSRILFNMWNVSDFTLGFKMFRRSAAQDIFAHQFDNHYVAEAEIIYVSRVRAHQLVQLAVTWTDHRDSRIHAFRDSFRSLKGLAWVMIRRVQGRYSLSK